MTRDGRAFALMLCAFATPAFTDVSAARLEERLALAITEPASTVQLLDPAAVDRFYAARAFEPAWAGTHCEIYLAALVAAIRESESHGLDPARYHRDALASAAGCDPDTELRATDAWLALAAHLHSGLVDPLLLESAWTPSRPRLDFAALLETSLAGGDVRAPLLALAPDQPFYFALREMLAGLRNAAPDGGRAQIDAGRDFRIRDGDPRVGQLRARLVELGLLDTGSEAAGTDSDAALTDALKSFQRSSNLEPDGIVGPLTMHQLNRGVADRIAQVRANLERWRWLPDDLGDRHIEINIADFRLEAHAQGKVERTHRTIVGLSYRQTPMMLGRITYLVLNPWWETPRRLAVLDKLPQFRKDPEAVQRLGFQVLDRDGNEVDPAIIDWDAVPAQGFPYRLRQRPGPQNALGRVKMMFPNVHDVYLHDTPAQVLFEKSRRAFSSGCIRVDNALDLASWLLAGTAGWDRARIDSVVASGAVTTITLGEAVPVQIVYLTAVPDGAGGVRLIDDVYGRDAALNALVDAPPAAHSSPAPETPLRAVAGSCNEDEVLTECGCASAKTT